MNLPILYEKWMSLAIETPFGFSILRSFAIIHSAFCGGTEAHTSQFALLLLTAKFSVCSRNWIAVCTTLGWPQQLKLVGYSVIKPIGSWNLQLLCSESQVTWSWRTELAQNTCKMKASKGPGLLLLFFPWIFQGLWIQRKNCWGQIVFLLRQPSHGCSFFLRGG